MLAKLYSVALEGAVVAGGLSAIGAGLYSIGIPKDSVVRYETAIKAGKYVIVAHVTGDEVANAKKIIEDPEAIESDVYHIEPVKVQYSVSPQKDTELGVILKSLASHGGAIPFGDSVPGPVAMREYGFTVGNVCEQENMLEGKTNG